eukprot:gene9446-9612_t
MAASHRYPHRRLTQAYASASSVSTGGVANSVSNAVDTGSGQPTVSVVNSAAGPGQVVDCEQTSVNGQQQVKNCPPKSPSKPGPSAAWGVAPACTKPPSAYKVVKDLQGLPWGWDGVSCALRDAAGKPLV